MSRAPVTGGHRAVDDGSGRCVTCRISVVDWGRGVQHQQGWRARQERIALGLPVRTGVAKPGSRAAAMRELVDRNALLEAENERLRAVLPITDRLDRLEALLARLLDQPRVVAVDHRRLADGGQRVRHQRR